MKLPDIPLNRHAIVETLAKVSTFTGYDLSCNMISQDRLH